MDHPINQDWLSRDGMPVRIASGTGPYQCRLQAIGQDGVAVDDSGITDTLTAYDLNGAAHAVDEIVWVKPSPIPDGDGKTIYMIQSGGGVGFFPVLVKWNAGSDGDSTTYASWTYDLYALADTGYASALNGSALQPENSPARIVQGPVTKAGDGTVGQAYYATDGTIKLYSCCEKHGKVGCTT
jgi:hypothetical protein